MILHGSSRSNEAGLLRSIQKNLVVLAVGAVASCWATLVNGQTWRLTTAPTNEFWQTVVSSADGAKLYAVSTNGIYASTNGGIAWAQTSAPATNWSGITCSADGLKLVAVGGQIYISTNAGSTWGPTGSSPFTSCQGLASSADLTKLVAVAGLEFQTGRIFTSTNSGVTWTVANSPTNGFGWYAVASSADGTKLVAMMVDELTPGGPIGPIYTSTNSGASWTPTSQRFSSPISLASSADGTRLVAAEGVNGPSPGGAMFTSADSGTTWLAKGFVEAWSSVACSADGRRIAAAIGGVAFSILTGPVYTSTDSGTTWTASNSPTNYWASIASSADGCKLVAAVNGGGIYIGQITPTPNVILTASAEGLILSWTVPSMPFVLEQTSDLSSGTWTDLGASPALNYATLQFEVALPKAPGTTFYRLVSQ